METTLEATRRDTLGKNEANRTRQNGKVPADILAKLPPAESYDKAVFPTLDEQGAGKEVVTKQWDTVVGAVVK